MRGSLLHLIPIVLKNNTILWIVSVHQWSDTVSSLPEEMVDEEHHHKGREVENEVESVGLDPSPTKPAEREEEEKREHTMGGERGYMARK